MSAKVAFCVVAWNNAGILPTCLDSLLAQTGVPFDIYMIDNASTDNTRTVMADYPQVKTTWSPVNTGFARGNNILIRKALKDPDVQYVALVNTDATLDPAWAANLVRVAESRPNVGSLQGLTLDYFDHNIVDSMHIFVNPNLHAQQYGYGKPVADGGYYPRKVFGVNAAACMYTRPMIEALPDRQHGFFDQRFFMYYEDIDVSYRALVCGWDAWFVPDAVAYHMGSVSTKKRGSMYSLKMIARNTPVMAFKNTPASVLRRNLPNIVYGFFKVLQDLSGGNGILGAAKYAVWYAQGLARLPRFAASRRRILGAQVTDDDYLRRIFRQNGILG